LLCQVSSTKITRVGEWLWKNLEEDVAHEKAIEYIKNNYDYASITHDKDLDENKNLKKKHTHIVLSTPNGKWNTALAEELNIPENYIQKCRSFSNALEYLIHYNDDTKEQYDINLIQGNLKQKLIQILNNEEKTECDKVIELLTYIDNCDSQIDARIFNYYVAKQGMWDVYRRASSIFLQHISEHNSYKCDNSHK